MVERSDAVKLETLLVNVFFFMNYSLSLSRGRPGWFGAQLTSSPRRHRLAGDGDAGLLIGNEED